MHLGGLGIQLHVTLFDVVEKHAVPAFLAGFHDALVAGQIGVAGQQADAQPSAFAGVFGIVRVQVLVGNVSP